MTALDRIASATEALEPPFAAVDAIALDANSAELTRRAGGKPVRVASKSVRTRAVLERVLGPDFTAREGFRGLMTYSPAEALWLAGLGAQDVLMGYPTVDDAAIAAISRDRVLSGRITLMVDDTKHLDIIRAAAGSDRLKPRVCIDVDASLRLGPLHLGVRRSPLREPAQVARFAREAKDRGFRVVGLMFYEAQIAGLPDSNFAVELVKRASAAELRTRRKAVVDAVQDAVGDLEFVNSGGTGSLEVSSADPVVTEVTAGSGLFSPTLFDRYKAFESNPALYFALSVVRTPTPKVATAFGGGYIASGPASTSRLPSPIAFGSSVVRGGLKLLRNEGAGEVQTPVTGTGISIGDRIWFRHAKAGEVCERFDALHIVESDGRVTTVPTYRGEGKNFG
ncbi:amino acid deaminase/aldolase [Rhodococcoides kyotonense]|uniref:D-serine deaminase, pyridoxal phosphate-dependent n=1 Tax=Rhodococcoides kyotonense TaxID=398843 RepID=A0A239I0A1_9NOCA|nr:amino acid deaminase/aldolase [Rhodococcus kyotonensis]SNS86768.1 D-serine deaminase, pyridoxal phosphate-dependent [Rhodococcus kyotonensis]